MDGSIGEILLDGKPLTDYSEGALRASCSVVSQRVHLFADTLRGNLTWPPRSQRRTAHRGAHPGGARDSAAR